MSNEEERLARLLKRMVPEPPSRLSADQITASPARPRARSWLVPALAAAAVVAIGVPAGLVAAYRPERGDTVTLQVQSPSAGSAAPGASASCRGRTVVVPDVIGVSMDAAFAIIQDAGLNVGEYNGVPPASAHIAPGLVAVQLLPAGSKAVPGALIWLEIATAPSTSTAAPIDPGMDPTATPTPASPCQAIVGTPAPPGARGSAPNVVGMTASQATRVARAAGLTVSQVVTPAPASRPVAAGTVFAQSPPAGSSWLPGSGMIFYVAPTASR